MSKDTEKLDKILDVLGDHLDTNKRAVQEIKESQVRMEDDLRYHIKRTDLLEQKLNNDVGQIKDELAPIKDHVEWFKSLPDKIIKLSKVIAALGVIGGAITVFVHLYFHK